MSPGPPPNGFDFSVTDLEDLGQVVDMAQNELQIPKTPGALQKINAVTAKTGRGRRITPAIYDLGRLRTGCRVSFRHQAGGDPSAADLVFLSEFAFAARADYRHAIVASGQIGRDDGIVPEATQVHSFATGSLMNHPGTR